MVAYPCDACDGYQTSPEPCPKCNGTGQISEETKMDKAREVMHEALTNVELEEVFTLGDLIDCGLECADIGLLGEDCLMDASIKVVDIAVEAVSAALKAANLTIEEDWKPIEEAPKDGTEVELKHKQFGKVRARWGSRVKKSITDKYLGTKEGWEIWEWPGRWKFTESTAFTHFKPIPKGPDSE